MANIPLLFIEQVITIAHWRKLFKNTSYNGRRIGKARIHYPAVLPSHPCLQLNG
jgi:hypothetical protein